MDYSSPNGYVIIQAGGKGTRLEQYTWNKPKCLAPLEGKPLIYHTFDAFPGAKFLIIVEYKKDVIARFLSVFRPDVQFELVEAHGASGTVSGIRAASLMVPTGEPVTVVWCDLRFTEPPMFSTFDEVVVGTTDAFPCRWSMDHAGGLVERRSDSDGVVGLFRFPNGQLLETVPESGELVEWIARSGFPFVCQKFTEIKEIGTIDALTGQWAAFNHARFFNSVLIESDRVIKRAKLPEYQDLLDGEVEWYRKAISLGFRNIPTLIDTSPLTMRRIRGRHPFEMPDNARGRSTVLSKVIDRLDEMHSLDSGVVSSEIALEVYEKKTLQRLRNIKALLPEITTSEFYIINGVRCRNILHEKYFDYFNEVTNSVLPTDFVFSHGDPTFSNIIIDEDGEPIFIDPRGKFGSSWFFGDPNYDWAKLYYSVVGDYDNFNRRRFIMEMDGSSIVIQIQSGGWSHLKGLIHERLPNSIREIKVLHGLIWLSLSGYVSDDYDSILASFFNGLLVLEEANR